MLKMGLADIESAYMSDCRLGLRDTPSVLRLRWSKCQLLPLIVRSFEEMVGADVSHDRRLLRASGRC